MNLIRFDRERAAAASASATTDAYGEWRARSRAWLENWGRVRHAAKFGTTSTKVGPGFETLDGPGSTEVGKSSTEHAPFGRRWGAECRALAVLRPMPPTESGNSAHDIWHNASFNAPTGLATNASTRKQRAQRSDEGPASPWEEPGGPSAGSDTTSPRHYSERSPTHDM